MHLLTLLFNETSNPTAFVPACLQNRCKIFAESHSTVESIIQLLGTVTKLINTQILTEGMFSVTKYI